MRAFIAAAGVCGSQGISLVSRNRRDTLSLNVELALATPTCLAASAFLLPWKTLRRVASWMRNVVVAWITHTNSAAG
jgi:hypothetical protein